MIRLGQVGLGGLTLPELLRADRANASTRDRRPPLVTGARARSCILLFLWGGPPQQDMWDMKPDSPDGVRSIFKPIPTNVSGIEFCEHLPKLAKQADKLCLIRSMTHNSDVHEASCYHVLTGQIDPTMVVPVNNRKRSHFPGPGGVASRLLPAGSAPTSVTLPRPVMHDGTRYAGTHAGFLGGAYDPVELPETPLVNGRPVLDMGLPPGVDPERLVRRRGLLELVETQDRYLQATAGQVAIDPFRERAFSLLASSEARRAFDLGLESPETRDRYGRNHYGESFLLARRLVEAGVRLVTINWMFFRPDGNPLNPWDNHGGTAALGGVTGFEMLKADYCIPPLDSAYSALLEDLAQRGMLAETLVVATGEFGRTPKINKTAGRDHWGQVYTALLAGGGIRGGQVYGASDEQAAYVKEDPVRPEDLLATMYHALGIPAGAEVRDREGRPHAATYGRPLTQLMG